MKQFFQCGLHDIVNRRHHRRNDTTADILQPDIIQVEQRPEFHHILQFRVGKVRGDALHETDPFSVDTSDHYIGISNVDCQDHILPCFLSYINQFINESIFNKSVFCKSLSLLYDTVPFTGLPAANGAFS